MDYVRYVNYLKCKHEIWVDAEMYEDEEKPQKGITNVKACLKCGEILDDIK